MLAGALVVVGCSGGTEGGPRRAPVIDGAAGDRAPTTLDPGGSDVPVDGAPADVPQADAQDPDLAFVDTRADLAADLIHPDLPPDIRPDLSPPDAPAAAPGGDCTQVIGGTVTRQVQHLGAGHEVTVRLAFASGLPPLGTMRGCVRALDASGRAIPAAVEARALTAAHLVLLVDPGRTAEENRVVLELVRAIVAERPAADRIFVFRWGATAVQTASAFLDRSRVLERAAANLVPTTEARAPLADALAAIAPPLDFLGGEATDVLRAVVAIAPRKPEPPSRAALAAAEGALVLHVAPTVADAPFGDAPAGLRVNLADAAPTAAVIGQRLEAYKARGHVALGICGTGDPIAGTLRLGAMGTVPLALPASDWANLGGRCDFAGMAAGRQAFTRKIEFLFNDTTRALMQVAASSRRSSDFAVQVKLTPDHLPTNATASFRGASSMNCPRRNYNVAVDGPPRHLVPGAAHRRFHLISMCLDRAYLRTYTTMQLFAELGLFFGHFELVELAIDGVSQGVYLLTENNTDGARMHFPNVNTVLRRNNTGGGTTGVELEYAQGKDEKAIATYREAMNATAADGGSGAALEQALKARFDFDQYLQWLATMNALGSGDYVDEVFFIGTHATDTTGAPATYYQISAWDQDDIFARCHANGRDAVVDPFGLMICAEAEIDYRIFGEPHLYRRYTETLATITDRLTTARFEAALRVTVDKLLAFFRDPQLLAAMGELRRIDPAALTTFEAAQSTLALEAATLLNTFDLHREEVLRRLTGYREGRPLSPLDAGADAPTDDAGTDAPTDDAGTDAVDAVSGELSPSDATD